MKLPEANESDGGTPLRSWRSFRFFEDILVEQGQAIADTKIVLGKGESGPGLPDEAGVTVNSVRQTSWPRKRSQTASIA